MFLYFAKSVVFTNYILKSLKQRKIVNPNKDRSVMVDVVANKDLFKEIAVHSAFGTIMLWKIPGNRQSYFTNIGS